MRTLQQTMLRLRQSLRRPTLIEALVVIAIITATIALLLPEVKWAASGDITVPVKVMVFDAVRDRPIPGARVEIFRAFPIYDLKSLKDDQGPMNRSWRHVEGTTNAAGEAIIETKFTTGANHERPEMYAHLSFYWAKIEADGYGGVVIPVRHEGVPSKHLRNGELRMTVGLLPLKTEAKPSL